MESGDIAFDPSVTSDSALCDVVNAIGYDAAIKQTSLTKSNSSGGPQTVNLKIGGMTCASCVHAIEG